ncbi:MAG: 30S ribosomal protein S9 [Candidatus Zambryskibacteria bacterium RIFCSPHIGHO2_01_FULL_43_25]|uniref:Small ribosomal subunit protein uS9 n=1 Tax=Candidatus Zambryskibacteria bacterium RIFCSPLOWO2_01_FULL_45_21 TaxID=1802761 RepID=A0A1G2U5D8_9BACT|nr:MAG: 30S ribosomal protein S9 [Candidatus Zambryskibacteria bacterium RIFCSPHIGHO2_01_FULL_43_25]OHB00563.1 MAG: 30S ribosomal protein S9 [Candidatus Zambryskibacteria bacterium RIFCSPHIGHO2_12_FULL_44_12b]OHB04707.1 MAG: 30S ribosomal protein S9 [Candidatus Zambryskibacteria bacterium RIFCSPLOWO2_01_FULL_45_21]
MKEETKHKYIETVGRRKTSVARVRITPASKLSIVINKKELKDYFPTATLKQTVNEPLGKAKQNQHFNISVSVKGGGISSQAEAIRHGISRGLVIIDESQRKTLKKAGYLKRNPKMKERRKFGLKKARKAPQWSKR